MKKIIFFFIIIISIILILGQKIITKFLITNLSKTLEHKIEIDKIKINYKKSTIKFEKLRVINKNNFDFPNIFEAESIIIDLELKSIFTNYVLVNDLKINNATFFIEIKESVKDTKNKKMITDNIEIVEKILVKKIPKKYPIKKRDKNFFITNTNIINGKVKISYPESSDSAIVTLSNMTLKNIANSDNKTGITYQHYKDIIKMMLTDVYFRISDLKLKNFIKRNYNLD